MSLIYIRGGGIQLYGHIVLVNFCLSCVNIYDDVYLEECHKKLMIGFHQQQLLTVKLEITLFI